VQGTQPGEEESIAAALCNPTSHEVTSQKRCNKLYSILPSGEYTSLYLSRNIDVSHHASLDSLNQIELSNCEI
jgi:hypothetical protein